VILAILFYKDWDRAKKLFSLTEAVILRDSLIDTKFILDKSSDKKFTETVISRSNVAKLLDVRADQVNFLEFFTEYPPKVGSRVLRPMSSDTIEGKKLEKKYLARIKSEEEHRLAIEATKAFVRKKRIANEMKFLPALERVINNQMWESWMQFVVRYGENKSSDHIDDV
jgi:hypothetical protein